MKQENLILIGLPFLLSALVIFSHYKLLVSQNPEAHSKPLITTLRVQSLTDEELKPISPQSEFPNNATGFITEVPTSKNQLAQLLEAAKSEQANTLFIQIGLLVTADGNLIIKQAAESSEDTLLRWTQKTVSDAHQNGLHTYVSLELIEENPITDPAKFFNQLSSLIERWAGMAQQYHVTFFNPGITLGYPAFALIPLDQMQTLVVKTERKTREYYTGRIGIGLCSKNVQISSQGYNQLLVITKSADRLDDLKDQALIDAKKYAVEHIYHIDLETKALSTIK